MIYILVLKDDLCIIVKNFFNFEFWLKVFKIDFVRGDRLICDRYFIKELGEWFWIVDGNEMVNNRIIFFECGI